MKKFCFSTVITIVMAGLVACGGQNDKQDPVDQGQPAINYHGTPTPIGSSGFTIDLMEGYAIDSQIDSLFTVYYFKPTDSLAPEDEAGIYFGTHPDTSAPTIDYSKKLIDGNFMGNSVKWVEYTTGTYTQREVFVDRGPNDKIHCWCYSHDPVSLEELFWMIRTIR